MDATIDRQGRVLVAYADGCTSPACIQAGASDYRKNDYLDKATIARQSGGLGLFAAFDGEVINSLVSLQTTNPGSAGGINSFNLTIKNTSNQSIFTPLRLEVASLTSPSGKVKVNNADNGGSGTGANWDYSNSVGIDRILSAGEVSGARNLKFNNSGNEAFTVNFNVRGNLTPNGSISSHSPSAGGASSSSAPSASSPAATVTNMVFSVTYNPVLNTLTWKLSPP
jgi:hypothetical protein